MKGRALLACWVAFLVPAAWAGESVLYSISDKSVLYPATNRPVSVSVLEYKTDIFAADPETGSKRLVFSDANADFLLLQGGMLGRAIIPGGRKIFAFAIDRQNYANDPSSPGALYELSTDGSNKLRKVFEIERGAAGSNFRNAFANPSGSKIGNLNIIGGKTYLSIHDVATGNLVRKTDLRYSAIERSGWSFGSVENTGWMPDDKRIFFALAMAGDEDEAFWTTPSSPVGTYIMNEDADVAERLAPEAALHPKIAGLEPSNDTAAIFLGALSDGSYLFYDFQYGAQAAHPGMYLYALDVVRKTQRIFPLNVSGNPSSFYLSPSNTKLVLTSVGKRVETQPKYSVMSTVDVWVLDLESGNQSKLFSFTTPDVSNTKGPWMSLIGWVESR
jgi:hypothetical protein